MNDILCGGCNKNKAPIHKTYGPVWCKTCINTKSVSFKGKSYPEFTPQSIKESRKEHKDALEQPFLKSGDFNPRFGKTYPRQAQKMYREGSITKKEYRSSNK